MAVNGEMVLSPTSFGLISLLDQDKACPGVEEVDKRVGMRGNKGQESMAIFLGHYKRGATITQRRGDKADRQCITGPMIFNGNNANAICHSRDFGPFRDRAFLYLLEKAPEDHYLVEYNPELHEDRLLNIRRRFKRWGMANYRAILDIEIDSLGMDKRIRNRQKEIWTILYRVSQFVGGEWPDRCQAAAKAFCLGIYEGDELPVISHTEELLYATRNCFGPDDEFLSTDELLDRLCRLPAPPAMVFEWKSYKASTMGLSKALAAFGIVHVKESHNGERAWGYRREDLYEEDEEIISAE